MKKRYLGYIQVNRKTKRILGATCWKVENVNDDYAKKHFKCARTGHKTHPFVLWTKMQCEVVLHKETEVCSGSFCFESQW